MRDKLELKPISYGDEGSLHKDRKPYQYRVILSTGEVILPDGEEALISETHLNGKWEILLMTGGVSHRQGEYENPEDALAVLQQRVDAR